MTTTSQTVGKPEMTEHQQNKFELGIWHTLFNWSILTIAIQNNWGGPASSDKRDWLAGAVSDQFATDPQTDNEDVEVLLLQVLEDEFGVRLEDETEVAVAKDILRIRKEVQEGNFTSVDGLQKRWEQRQGKEVVTGNVQVREADQEGEWDSIDEESDEEDEDMTEAPALAPARPKPAPEVDDEGFTKVVGKKRN